MTPINPLRDADELLKDTTSTIKVLGPITVAFFILLACGIYAFYQNITNMQMVHAQIIDTVTEMNKKVDSIQTEDRQYRILNAYYLRQLCFNTSNNTAQKAACDPPPRLSANTL